MGSHSFLNLGLVESLVGGRVAGKRGYSQFFLELVDQTLQGAK